MALKNFAFKVLAKDNFARSGLIETHRGNIGLIRRCIITCGIFNFEIIVLLVLLLLTLVRSLFM